MPNHVYQRLVIDAPNKETLDKLLEATKHEGEHYAGEFSAHAIIPMPECLINTSSGSDESLTKAIIKHRAGDDSDIRHIMGYPWMKGDTPAEAVKYLMEQKDVTEQSIADLKKVMDETGYSSWYPWANANWGTKWGMYDVSIDRTDDESVTIYFQSAWSPPTPVIDRLSDMFPTVSMSHYYADEGGGFAGVRTYDQGVCTEDNASYQEGSWDHYCEMAGAEYLCSYNNEDEEEEELAPIEGASGFLNEMRGESK